MRATGPEESPGGCGRPLLLALSSVGALLALAALYFFVRGSVLHGDIPRLTARAVGLWPFDQSGTAHHLLLALFFLTLVGLVWAGISSLATLIAILALGIGIFSMGDSWGNPSMLCGFAQSCSDAEMSGRSDFGNAALLDTTCVLLTLMIVIGCVVWMSATRHRNETVPETHHPLVPIIFVAAGLLLCLGLAEVAARQAAAELPAATSTPRSTTPIPISVAWGPARLPRVLKI
jgi:hypothetical protein